MATNLLYPDPSKTINSFSFTLPVGGSLYQLYPKFQGLVHISFSASSTITVFLNETFTGYSGGFAAIQLSSTTPTSLFVAPGESNLRITVTKIITPANSVKTGILEVLTNTQTYTQTGEAIAMVFGGGGGGANTDTNNFSAAGGPGGAGGRIVIGNISLPGSTPVVIGAGGPSGTGGGNSSIGNLSSINGIAAAGGTGVFSPATLGNPGGVSPFAPVSNFFGATIPGSGGGGGGYGGERGNGGGAGRSAVSGNIPYRRPAYAGGGGGGYNAGFSTNAPLPGGGYLPRQTGGPGGNGAVCLIRYT